MRTLIVGVGAIGGVVAARMRAAGAPVHLATRSAESAAALQSSGLSVAGVGGAVSAAGDHVAPLESYRGAEPFDLIVLATKARDAVEAAPSLVTMLSEEGTLLPLQNGGVAHLLADRLGDCVLGGLSNLGATMLAPGTYEQRNAGHLLIGELRAAASDRVARIERWLGQGVPIRTTTNMSGSIWSKILVNCAVTTIAAIAGTTMRGYMRMPEGPELFDGAYDEALSVALASGARPETMIVEPIPPGWSGRSVPGPAHSAWLDQIIAAYGDLKPSMLQDFERGRITEIDFINGYVVSRGRELGVATPINELIVETVRAITAGEGAPDPRMLTAIAERVHRAA